MTVQTPWSTVGLLTYKRTYARRLVEDDINSRTENFPDTVERVIGSARDQLKVGFTKEEEDRLRNYLLGLKGSVAGRFWWQMGTDTVNRLGLASLQNCAFTTVDDPVRPFTWAMDMLMLGSGVGYNIQKENVDKLPKVNKNFKSPIRKDTNDADFIVPDSREGWVQLLAKTLKAAFLSDKLVEGSRSFSFSTSCIRGKGAAIKGFGGTASGPEDLCWGINEISKILEKRAGRKIRPIDALDIMNIIGAVVVAGNVRRSAQIAIGDHDDIEYLLAKRWDLGNIPSWRAMSNNSIVCHDTTDLHQYFWDGYEGKGEPYGLINLELSRKTGRIDPTGIQYPDPDVKGYNPCLTGDTIVKTTMGDMRLDSLCDSYKEGKAIDVLSYNIETKAIEAKPVIFGDKTRENAEVIEIETEDGKFIKLTPDHKVFTENRGYVEAKDLTGDDVLISI